MARSSTEYNSNIESFNKFLSQASIYNASANMFSTTTCVVDFQCANLEPVNEESYATFYQSKGKLGQLALEGGTSMNNEGGYPLRFNPKLDTYIFEGDKLTITGTNKVSGSFTCILTSTETKD